MSEWCVMKASKRQGLEDSLIALQQQAKKLIVAYEAGERKWSHGSIAGSIVDTGKAMILDAGSLQDLDGANEWNEKMLQFGRELVKDFESRDSRRKPIDSTKGRA